MGNRADTVAEGEDGVAEGEVTMGGRADTVAEGEGGVAEGEEAMRKGADDVPEGRRDALRGTTCQIDRATQDGESPFEPCGQ